jgi:hypothetical protein
MENPQNAWHPGNPQSTFSIPAFQTASNAYTSGEPEASPSV